MYEFLGDLPTPFLLYFEWEIKISGRGKYLAFLFGKYVKHF